MKKDFIKQLKEQWDGSKIGEIEKSLKVSKGAIYEEQRKFYSVLYYLKFTGRFRENRRFKKMPWGAYIRDMFNISERNYHDMVYAILRFPKESENFGPGTVTRIKNACGPQKIEKVFQEISKIPKKENHQKKIEEIIFDNAKPKVKAVKERQPISLLEKNLSDAKDRIIFLEAEIAEKDKQIKKLKAALKKYEEMSFMASDSAQADRREYALPV